MIFIVVVIIIIAVIDKIYFEIDKCLSIVFLSCPGQPITIVPPSPYTSANKQRCNNKD